MKKIIQIFITLAVVALTVPAFAYADTISDLQAQIAQLSARLAALQGGASYTNTCPDAFTKTLEIGMVDADVIQLQRVLNSSYDTQVASYGAGSPGNETAIFGERTRLAVIRYQNKYREEILYPMGMTYGTGVVGAATRAKLNESCIYGEGAVLGASTDIPSSGTITTTGSNSNSNSDSGSNSNSNSSHSNNDGLDGGAGSISINSYSSDVEDGVTTGSPENILGFKIRADGSDVRITHVKLVLNYSGSKTSYLTRYFKSFDIYTNDERVARIDADEFNRDSSGQYSKTFTLDDAIVRMGSSGQKTFYVRALGQDYIDSDIAGSSNGTWTVRLDETRFRDATGYTFSDGTDVSNSGVYVEKLSTSGDVKVRISTGSENPETKTVFVSNDSSGDRVTMLEFKLKAEGTRVQFDQLKTNVSVSGSTAANMVSEFRLERSGSVLATTDGSAVSGGVLTFNLDDLTTIDEDDTETYRVVARMQRIGTGSFSEGSTMAISFSSVSAQDKNGDNISSYSGSATGRTQTFRSTGMNVTHLNHAQYVNSNNNNPASSYAEYRMQVRVTASGDDIWVPLTIATSGSGSGFLYDIRDSGNNVITTGTKTQSVSYLSGGSRDGEYVKIADGESATFEIVSTFDPLAAGQYNLQLASAGYTTVGATGSATAQISATPDYEFQTSRVYIPN